VNNMQDTDKSITGFEQVLLQADAFVLMSDHAACREAALQAERQIITEWAASAPEKTLEREQAYLKLQVLMEVLAQLDTLYVDATVSTGSDQLQPIVN